ncbi:radical SAM protein, partial [Bacteroidales bacterium MSK.15.36]|nr:radical SAM protein [Bacteroidales bacterium MSK.15.36]
MKISKKDALKWFEFFAILPEDEEVMIKQQEIIYATFAQIEEAIDHRNNTLMSEIKGLKTLENRTFFVGNENKFAKGCRSCLLGTGLSAIRKTNKCNIECKFCYNYGELDDIPPIGEGMWEIGGTKFYEKDIDLLLSIHKKPTGISYVYLEPFMEIEKYYSIIKKFRDAKIHQHLYTNGILATEETLKALGEAGLDEIRFNLGASNCSDKVIENIGIAKKYIKNVGIETPMTPEFFE